VALKIKKRQGHGYISHPFFSLPLFSHLLPLLSLYLDLREKKWKRNPEIQYNEILWALSLILWGPYNLVLVFWVSLAHPFLFLPLSHFLVLGLLFGGLFSRGGFSFMKEKGEPR